MHLSRRTCIMCVYAPPAFTLTYAKSLTQKGSEVFDRDRKITEYQAKLDACETAKKLAIAEAVEKKNFRLANNKADEFSIKSLQKMSCRSRQCSMILSERDRYIHSTEVCAVRRYVGRDCNRTPYGMRFWRRMRKRVSNKSSNKRPKTG